MTAPLYLVRLALDRRELSRLAARHRLPRSVDEGYMLHAGLAQLFARSDEPSRSLVQPFAVDDLTTRARREPGLAFLLGYSSLAEDQLSGRVQPSARGLLRQLVTRDVPVLPRGAVCAFRTRVCPVVRTKQPGAEPGPGDRGGRTRSREIDAWLAHRLRDWKNEPPREWPEPFDAWADRGQVYRAWLARELATPRAEANPPIERAAAELLDATMVEFGREPLLRKGAPAAEPQARARRFERPNAVLEGALRVEDPDAFRALLARGVGRHRAFGFGMLLLRSLGRGPAGAGA